jgi:hypothetical protein
VPKRRTALLADLGWIVALVPLAIVFTWPLAARFTTELAGDDTDPWQNLWNISWVHQALVHHQNLFYTTDLWYPDGATLVFQTMDWPDALWGGVVFGWLGPIATYNLVVLWTFVASGAAMYALGRGTGASRPASFLSACAYTFSTYHFGHALAHLHILAMQWVPLYVLALWKMIDGASSRWAWAAGVFLSLATLSSWYYLTGCFILTMGILLVWVARDRGRSLRRFLPDAARLVVAFLALVGPLGLAMLRERAAEPFEGQHAAWFSSADLQSFVLPNAAQLLGRWSHAHEHWTGNDAENSTYLGFVLVLTAVVGLRLRAERVLAYLLAALIGVVLALGPALHVGGVISPHAVLPYAWLTRALPLLDFMGGPVRFAFAATFGLSAALAPALDALRARSSWLAAAPLAVAAILEHAPHAFVTWRFPTPSPVASWATDLSPFAVLDLTPDSEALWHQVVHGHPMMGGYLSRTPHRLLAELAEDPVAGPLNAADPPQHVTGFRTPTLDLPMDRPVVTDAETTNFSIELHGRFVLTQPGRTAFTLRTADPASVLVDGASVFAASGAKVVREVTGGVDLTQGPHDVTVLYAHGDGTPGLQVWWTPPGATRRPLGGGDTPGGFGGAVTYGRRELAIGREEALAHLRSLKIRYIIQPGADSPYATEVQLGLHPIHTGEGVRVYEVPDA